jgi:hypothetical protein
MAAAMAMYPQMKQALGRMTTEGAKIDGTPILTTMSLDAVQSAEQMADSAKQQTKDDDSKSSAPPTSIGGLLGGFAKKATTKKSSEDENKDKSRANIFTSTTEVLKVEPSVSATDLAIPMGFKENK